MAGRYDLAQPTARLNRVADDELAQRILACVESIPAGRVMSYGDVAEYAGASSPRIVGRVLAMDGGTVPWHRVLRSDGTLADHLYDEQRQRLLSEGVLFTGHKVRLAEYRWDGKAPRRSPLRATRRAR